MTKYRRIKSRSESFQFLIIVLSRNSDTKGMPFASSRANISRLNALLTIAFAVATFPVSGRTELSPEQANRPCIARGLRSILGGDAEATPESLLLHVEFVTGKARNAQEALEIVAIRNVKALPSGTYARNHPEKGSVELVKVANLDHAYLAIFNHSTYMNLALGRVTTFQTQKRIISGRALTQSNAQVQLYGGHDIPAPVAVAFQKAFLENAPPVEPESPKLKIERAFWARVMIPILKKDPKATVIAGALDEHPKNVFSHELLHAYFYERPEMQSAVAQFWREQVSPADRARYLAVLKREKYDLENQEQVLNEFLAYTLEEGGPFVFPRKLISSYRERLRRFLRKSRVEIP